MLPISDAARCMRVFSHLASSCNKPLGEISATSHGNHFAAFCRPCQATASDVTKLDLRMLQLTCGTGFLCYSTTRGLSLLLPDARYIRLTNLAACLLRNMG